MGRRQRRGLGPRASLLILTLGCAVAGAGVTAYAPAVADAGLTPIVTNTIMESLKDKTALAREILALLK